MSMFAAYNKVNVSVPEIETAISWMKIQFMEAVVPEIDLQKYTEDLLVNDATIKEYILKFLSSAEGIAQGLKLTERIAQLVAKVQQAYA